jgi:cytochrome c peroxidase
MKAFISIAILALASLTLSFVRQNINYSIDESPVHESLEWIMNKHLSLVEATDQFSNLLNKEETDELKVKGAFHQLKRQFKEVEFIYYYVDPQSFSIGINGAPLPKLQKKVPDVTVLEPKGFQRIEELIYTEENRHVLVKMVNKLKKHLSIYTPLFSNRYVTDPVIFEALRYGIIRINTMGITGFDAPGNTDPSLEDAALFFQSYLTILELYKKYIPKANFKINEALAEKAINDLRAASFETFNRFEFIQDVLDPIWRESLKIQKTLQIELPNQRFSKLLRPVNYSANSLYAADFLNTSFYAENTGGNDSRRIDLGEALFFDQRLSKSGKHSCASCHHPNKAFTDGLPLSKDLTNGGQGKRNSPTLINSVYAERYFHDMRVDRLAFQMDHVVLNPIEFNTRYDSIIGRLRKDKELNKKMTAVYGKEGITKNTITNAMSAFVASLTSFNSTFDKMIRSETKDIDEAVIEGFNIFMGKAACATCHFPPTFSGLLPPEYAESESEVLGVPSSPEAPFQIDPDLGRYMNHLLKEQVAFYKHAFKTPTVRNIGQTSPYMHNGVYSTIEEVIDFYDVGGGIGLGIDVPNQTLPSDSLHLTDQEKRNLKVFLEALDDNPFD